MQSIVLLTKFLRNQPEHIKSFSSLYPDSKIVELTDHINSASDLTKELPKETPDLFLVSAWDDLEDFSRIVGFLRLQQPYVALFLACDDEKMFKGNYFPPNTVDGYLDRDATQEHFLSQLQRLLNNCHSRKELWYLRRRDAEGSDIGSMVAKCPEMKKVVGKLMSICKHTIRYRAPTVLISGETGTGKGQLARAIHYNGTRQNKPLVEVNCASLPKELIEAELFGCERGAFTGADVSRPGLLEVADKGSIFLDEIGALRLDHQTKLLRFLDDHAVRRVGSATERRLDVQVITATNRDLATAVRMGEFREDLFYRLNTIELHLPPLRKRENDVILLARNFMEEFCKSYGRPTKRFSKATEKTILSYDWPGNIRELRNRIERIVLLDEHQVVESEALELPSDSVSVVYSGGKIQVKIPQGGVNLEEIEKAVLEEAVHMASGNVSQAAKLLGIGRSAIRYRLRGKLQSD